MAADQGWWAIVLPTVLGCTLSFALEQFLRPQPIAPWRRPPAAVSLHLGIWLLLFVSLLLLTRRPWMAATGVSALMLVVVLVSIAKLHALREPFVFQDFEYFTDALRHPRLYLPFFGFWRTLIAALAGSLAVFGGLSLEPVMTLSGLFAEVAVLIAIAAALLVGGATGAGTNVTFEPASDMSRLGLLAYLWRYGAAERQIPGVASVYDFLPAIVSPPSALPHVVVIQSESFFDPRALYAGIRPEVLEQYDALRAESVSHGRLAVSAWGANTVRTEFGFLSSLPAEALGVHRFQPYRRLGSLGLPTVATFLRKCGYRCVCVHPYQASFYRRDRVFPLLGFDELIDVRSFSETDRAGPYVGDVAVAEKTLALLRGSSSQPLFVFVITMENHGPLHLERVRSDEDAAYYTAPPPDGCDDLTLYLRHLCNADRMAGRLKRGLESLARPTWLCWYGDHVPVMNGVYRTLAEPEGRTEYLIWHSRKPGVARKRVDMKVEQLGFALLKHMEIIGTDSNSAVPGSPPDGREVGPPAARAQVNHG